ncbi:MAG: hypothetical protein AB1414_18210 [bacterium]
MKTPSYEERNKEILKAIIEDFILTGKPVSSKALSDIFSLSSATIRNVMADLERTEYITQPYPSAGRTPTDKGYRLYVNSLMENDSLDKKEKEEIIQGYEKTKQEEEIIEKTSHFLSSFSHYVGLCLIPQLQKVYLEGFSNLVNQPEFENIELLKRLFKIYENKSLLCEVLMEHLEDEEISITIGHENHYEDFYECSVITAVYKIEDEPGGAIGIIGPKRMPYSHIIPLVKFITNTLSKFLPIKK